MVSWIRLAASALVAGALFLQAGCQPSQESSSVKFPELETAKKNALGRDAAAVKIPWLGGQTLTRADAVKRFGRLVRHDRWENLTLLSTRSIELGDAELLALGWYYLTYVQAHELASDGISVEDAELILGRIREAVDLGFRNPYEIESAKPFLPLHSHGEFRSLISDLKTEFESKRIDQLKKVVDQELEISTGLEVAAWTPELEAEGGGPFFRDGEPMLVVVSRIHHDGFNKLAPMLEATRKRVGDQLPIAIAFYQYDENDTAQREQTKPYVEKLGLDFPYTVISRDEFKALMTLLEERHEKLDAARKRKNNPFNPFQPLGLFLTAERKPLAVSRGVLADWELDYLVDRFLATVRPPSETP